MELLQRAGEGEVPAKVHDQASALGGWPLTLIWIVVLILAILVALDSLAMVALVRQVGLIHLRVAPIPALMDETEGPQPGEVLSLPAESPQSANEDHQSTVYAFISTTCSLCSPLLPGLEALARAGQRVVLVSDAPREELDEYMATHRSRLPAIVGSGVTASNRIPGVPFVVVADRARRVLAAGGVNSLEQIELLIDRRDLDHGYNAGHVPDSAGWGATTSVPRDGAA